MKRCNRCGKEYPRTFEFFNEAYENVDKLTSCCRSCHRILVKKSYWANKEKIRNFRYLYKYGITHDEKIRMAEQQNFCCSICGEKQEAIEKLQVDHDHESLQVRELLCNSCNLLIGLAKEDVIVLVNAIKYLTKHKEG